MRRAESQLDHASAFNSRQGLHKEHLTPSDVTVSDHPHNRYNFQKSFKTTQQNVPSENLKKKLNRSQQKLSKTTDPKNTAAAAAADDMTGTLAGNTPKDGGPHATSSPTQQTRALRNRDPPRTNWPLFNSARRRLRRRRRPRRPPRHAGRPGPGFAPAHVAPRHCRPMHVAPRQPGLAALLCADSPAPTIGRGHTTTRPNPRPPANGARAGRRISTGCDTTCWARHRPSSPG